MRRLGLPVILALFAATAIAADDKPEPKKDDKKDEKRRDLKRDADKGQFVIRWHGQSFFEITSSKGTKIVIDPHGLEQYRMNLVEEQIDADVILISHPHEDHSNLAVVKDFKDTAKVKQFWGVSRETRDWNKINETVKDVKIHVVPTYHDAEMGMRRGKNGVFVIEVDGMRIVHLGDLGHKLTNKQLMAIKGQRTADDPEKPVDILLIPVGGVYTLNGLVAQDVVEQIKPTRYTIPMHYGTLVYDWLLDLPKSQFLNGVPKKSIIEMKTNRLAIDPKAEAPKESKILILHYFEQ